MSMSQIYDVFQKFFFKCACFSNFRRKISLRKLKKHYFNKTHPQLQNACIQESNGIYIFSIDDHSINNAV